ncbi:MAG TPA: multicopper oxidase family protein [Alphaproteobacteria bacterium]|jgi:FtsP/CotA-like multicopper oxidase with cupredoxin domain
MAKPTTITPSRRRFLAGAAAAGALLPFARPRFAAAGEHRLTAAPARAAIAGGTFPETEVWAYDGTVPGPLLRVRRDTKLRVTLENEVADATSLHWHGIRLPNAMDGVPDLTQAPVKRGENFVYEFEARDSGTYWYHPHWQSYEQVERGLYGVLVVEEAAPPAVDRDTVWVLDDWRLTPEAKIAGGFANFFDVSHAGRLGNSVTVNGKVADEFKLRAGERIRLRLVNAANARIFGLRFGALQPRLIATDGHAIAPHTPDGNRIVLGPGMRADLILDCAGKPGERVTIVDDFYPRMAYRLLDLVYGPEPALRATAPEAPIALAPNALPEPKLAEAERHEIVFGGGMMGRLREAEFQGAKRPMREIMLEHRMAWAVNGKVIGAHDHAPFLTLKLGRSYIFALENDTAWHHPIHLHGHVFQVVARDGAKVARTEWRDTVLMNPRERVDIAFVADNPGDWMFHCHILEHQAGGMMAVVRVQ